MVVVGGGGAGVVLRQAWSLERYMAGGVEEGRSSGKSVNVVIADQGVSSPRFWGCMEMHGHAPDLLLESQPGLGPARSLTRSACCGQTPQGSRIRDNLER